MATIARRVAQSLALALGFIALLVASAFLIPPVGLVIYFPVVVGLEILEDHGWSTVLGSSDGWPMPTPFGWALAGATLWFLLALVLYVALRVRDRRRSTVSIRNAI